jgi:hypothetical protein
MIRCVTEGGCSPSAGFNEQCSPQSLEESHIAHQLGAQGASQDVISCQESSASCCSGQDENIELAFLAQAELHLRKACTASLLATWHKETQILFTGKFLRLHSSRSMQVSLECLTHFMFTIVGCTSHCTLALRTHESCCGFYILVCSSYHITHCLCSNMSGRSRCCAYNNTKLHAPALDVHHGCMAAYMFSF